MKALDMPRQEAGAITLLVAIGLVILASLVSFYSSRSVLMDHLATDNHAHASEARWAAEAALASAQTEFMRPGVAVESLLSNLALCPPGVSGPQWQCSRINLSQHPALPQALLSATAVRDLVMAPHVVTLHASARIADQNSQAQASESLFVPILAKCMVRCIVFIIPISLDCFIVCIGHNCCSHFLNQCAP